jgi:hypothetical protein
MTATCANFQGILNVNPSTGIISVTNAKQAGVFQIKVNAFDSNNQKTSTNFQITVTNPTGNPGYALGNFKVNIGDSPQKLAIGDFNNDGIQDIAAAAHGTSLSIFSKEKHEVTIAIGNKVARGQFTASTINYDREVQFVTVGDFNGDGNQDLAVNAGYETDIYLGQGNGQFDKNPQSLNIEGLNHLDCTLGDFNQDGIQDLSISSVSWGAYSTQMFLGLGDGNFSEVNGIDYGFLMRLAVTYADFNGDGIIDIICSKMNGAPLFEQSTNVQLGKGDGTFGPEINLDSRFGILST